MEIRNGRAFSPEINEVLEKYYSYILKQEFEYYKSLPQDILQLEKNISHLENKMYFIEEIVEWMEKHEDGSLFDMFIGCYAPDLRKYVEDKEKELNNIYSTMQEKIKFYDLYTNLLNNGVIIKDSENGCYSVTPYDNGIYMLIK